MKKIIILICLLLMCGFTLTSVNAEENQEEQTTETPEVSETPEEPIIVYPCKVTISDVKNGTIEVSKTEGEIGEIVEIYNTPDLLYDLTQLTVNGIVLTPDKYGIYSFALIEGENIVAAKFEVSDEKLEKIAELLGQAKEGKWEDIFTVSNLMQLISWIITTLCSSGFFITLYKSRKYKQLTPQEIAKQVETKLDNVLGEKLSGFLTDIFGPYSEAMLTKFEKMETSTKTLVRCFILMQENTPESRIAILKELDGLNSNETNLLTTQVKELIAEEVKKQEEQSKNLSNTLEELKVEVNNKPTHL